MLFPSSGILGMLVNYDLANRTSGISLERPLVMAILNVTPDSFSDGGRYVSLDTALRRAGRSSARGRTSSTSAANRHGPAAEG